MNRQIQQMRDRIARDELKQLEIRDEYKREAEIARFRLRKNEHKAGVEAKRLKRRILSLETSNSYRVGRVVLSPMITLKLLLSRLSGLFVR